MNYNSLEKKEALKISIKEGSAANLSAGIGANIISPFALRLSNNPVNIGLLSSIPGLISPFVQIWGSNLMKRYSRKKIVLTFVFLQAITWLPIALIGILFWLDIIKSSAIYFLIIFYTLFSALGGFAHPAWFSWMGDLVPSKERGRYFAKRNIVLGIVEVFAAIFSAFLIKAFTENNKLIGFSILFFISFISRLISFFLLNKQYIPKEKSLKEFVAPLKEIRKSNKNFIYFVTYLFFFHFSIMLASPFFAVYMKQELGFDDSLLILIAISSSFFYLIFSFFAGRFSDKYGNVRLIFLSNLLFSISPLLWLFNKNPIYLLLIPQFIAGAANAAYNISFSNFIYDSLKKEHRAKGIAFANVMCGFGIFFGATLGGFLLKYLSLSFLNKFFFIFLTASILRFLVVLLFSNKIKEERKVSRVPHVHISKLVPINEIFSFMPLHLSLNKKGKKI